MGVLVKLNLRSQELINDYLVARGASENHFTINSLNLDSTVLLSWLTAEESIPAYVSLKSKKDLEFIIASLRAELLRDLFTSLSKDKKNSAKPEEDSSWTDKLKFILLTLAGTLVAASEGFDSISTMLSVLSVPATVILVTGLIFSVLSIIVFYGFDLVQVSRNLGVRLKDAPKLMDVYLSQMTQIKAIRRTIDTIYLSELSSQELVHLELTLSMLEHRFKSLVATSKEFENALQSTKMKAAKFIVSAVAGLLFFGSGFFAGQSLALFIAGLIFTVVTPTFWPVVLFSVLVGAAAFSIYWYVERMSLKKLIGGWFGLEEDKINKLCEPTLLQKEEHKLQNLKEKIICSSRLNTRLGLLEQQFDRKSIPIVDQLSLEIKPSQNIYAFHSTAQWRDHDGKGDEFLLPPSILHPSA